MTLDGNILAVNAAVIEMSGYSEAELRQRNDRENVYPPDAEAGMELFAEMLAGKRDSYTIERRYLRKNGTVFWTRLTLSLVRDGDGKPAYLVAQIEDIDEQKRKAAALAESEARFRAMFENAAVGISLVKPSGETLAVNPLLVKLSGYSEAELLEKGGQGVTYLEDRALGRQEFQEIIAGKRDSFQVEKRYVHPDGRLHWMRQSVSAVRDAAGQAQYLIVIAEDIEERKRAVEELRESEARFRAMFDNAAVGVALMTLDRRIVQINPTMVGITGYSAAEMLAMNPSELVVEADRYLDRDLFVELVEGKRDQYIMEKRYLRKDGHIFWGRVNFALVRSANQQPLYIVGIIEDITEEKHSAEKLAAQEAEHLQQLEQRIAERTEELNLANEQLREKAAQDAVTAERTRLARELHDAVTQTLFSTTLIADVLPEIWALNPDEGRHRLEEIRQLTRGALAEMRTLLVELRPNALVEVPLPTLLRQLSEALAGRSRMTIQLSAEGEHKLPPDVQVGLYCLAQEALNNVVKHAKASQVVVSLRCHDESVRLTVADNGIGFDPSTVTADHLGLKIMRERAEAIGAKLSVYSEPGEGTQISIIW
jgi:PAS domain S-box-containing protein